MFRRHVSDRLMPFLDGRLASSESARVSAHLERCARCRRDLDQVRFGASLAAEVRPAAAPASLWREIEAALERQRRPRRRLVWAWAVAVLAAGFGLSAWWMSRARSGLEVVGLEGAPLVGAERVHGAARIAVGEWLETDATSRATIRVGDIGEVAVEPNTRIRLVRARADEHRLALARGTMRAAINAPPRLFFLETPSALAVDLGCIYTMQVDERGEGLLSVSAGWVLLESAGRESMVPGGALCRTRPGAGPGTPYFEDASERLRAALARFDFQGEAGAAETVLAESRARDTLTLWHLLARVGEPMRGRLYDRIAALAPVPAGVTRDSVMRLDRAALDRWRDELEWTW